MNQAIVNVVDSLKAGHLEKAYEFKQYLNDVAIHIYQKPELDAENLEDLKGLLTICNITYNDTDREVLPIEDGIYDLLLEKYKKYDPNFQVGAEVITFATADKGRPYIDRPMRDAVTFLPEVSDKDVFFLDDIVIDEHKFIDHRDFERKNTPQSTEFITKRHRDSSHEHPELVGTLDKVKYVLLRDASERGVADDDNVKILERDFFQNHLQRGIISPTERFDMILELKYDGVSVEADCTDEVVSARSRGDTGTDEAADWSPILRGYKFPHREPGAEMIGVKFEAIITKHDLPFFNAAKGYEYKNCRSAIVGLMSSGDAWKYRDFITLVPLAVENRVYQEVCHSDRMEEIKFLNDNFVSKGCPLRYTMVNGTYIENLAWINIFTQNAEFSRYLVPFMYDGIVVSYRDERVRQALGRENFINKYSIAVKFNPLRKETVFRGFGYTVGQDGSITPMIYYDPVEFFGTIHSKSSGHSYARFQELALRKGDVIDVEYVNDVMPYVSKPINDWNLDNEKVSPIEEFTPVCPICGTPIVISDSGKSARCPNQDCGGRQLSRMVNMCAKLGMEGFGEATIEQLRLYHLKDLLELLTGDNYSEDLRIRGFGPVESENLRAQAFNLLQNPLDEGRMLGSLGFTGISTKTWETILGEVEYAKLYELFNMLDPSMVYYKRAIEFMSKIRGIGPSTANTIAQEFKYFQKDAQYMYEHANIVPYTKRTGKDIRVSGFRDAELFKYLNSIGFVVDEDLAPNMSTFALLVPNRGFSSIKVKKAEKFGIPIIPVKEFMANIESYV